MKRNSVLLFIAVILAFQWEDSAGLESLVKEKGVAAKAGIIRDRGGDLLGFSDEISAMLENSCGIECRVPAEDYFDQVDRADEQAEHIDPYSVFSGGVSLRRALQMERVSYVNGSEGTIDPESLPSPLKEKLPYKEMLKGKKCRLYEIDRYTPADFYYLHLSDAGRISDVINYIENTADTLRRRISPVSVHYMTRERLLTQLALKEGAELNRFYTSAVDEMVITGSDPFIMEGSDITLVIRPKNSRNLMEKIDEIRREYRYAFKCGESEVTVAGTKGKLLSSGARRVYSLIFTLPDGTIIISNSLKGAETVIKTSSGKHPSLSDEPDYIYTRSVFPAQQAGEDAFLYISDRFVRHLLSPSLKIVEARRLNELMRMAVLEKYAVYNYLLKGRKSSDISEIVTSTAKTSLNSARKKELAAMKKNPSYKYAVKLERKYTSDWNRFLSVLSSKTRMKKSRKRRQSYAESLANAMKVFYRNMTGSSAKTPFEVLELIDLCGSGKTDNSKRFEGLSITEGGFTAVSNIYGRTGFMTPCIDIQAGMATGREAADYRDFTAGFGSSGEAFISPGGVKLTLGSTVSAEAFIFRSGHNPWYPVFSAFAGGDPVPLHPDSAVTGETLSISLKPDPAAIDRYLFMNDIRVRGNSGRETGMKNILSGEIEVHIRDSLPPAGFDFSALSLMLNSGGYGNYDAASGFFIWALLHPVRISMDVKNGADADAAAESVMKQLSEKWNAGNLVKSDIYSFEYSGTEIRVLKMTMLGSLTARVFSAVKNGKLHVATDEKYIKTSLMTRDPVNKSSVTGNAALVFRPAALNREKDVYRSGIIEEAIFKSRKNFGTIKLASLIYPGTPADKLPELLYNDFGFRPVCPLGGGYLIENRSGEVYSPVFGPYSSPLLRSGIRENGPVYEGLKDFFSTSEIRAEMEFTPEGMKFRFSTK